MTRLVISLLLGVAINWSLSARPLPLRGSALKIKRPYPVVGFIEKREKVITLKAGPEGTLYTIEKKNGELLVEDVSEQHLFSEFRDLYKFVKNAIASADSNKAGSVKFIDASLGLKPIESKGETLDFEFEDVLD